MRLPALLGATLAAVLLAGCGSSTAGEPNREPAATTSTKVDPTATSSPAKHSVNDLCGLLTEDEVATLAATSEPEEGFSTSDGHPQCTWSDETILTIGWSAGKSTSMAKTGPTITITPTTIHGLTAVQWKDVETTVTCQIMVDLPDGLLSATVTLNLDGEGKYDECTVAADAMNIIIPKVTEK